jgi:ATP-dependent helicase YprA (DUF1998 family)
MSIFTLRQSVIEEYSKYVQSFLSIADERIRTFIEDELLKKQTLWPDALLQLNPAYETAATIKDLVTDDKLHPLCAQIFTSENGQPIRLYRHQQVAIETALKHKHFVVTSGTGSGKTLTYFIPIFDTILRGNSQELKTRAIVVYPMNALVNSQFEALQRFSAQYKKSTGKECPVRFAQYSGQESNEIKQRIQQNPPHILLTNYVMLELMLVRPEEHNFVDRTTAGLEFLVIDEMHTYRGRQGADVALLIRRLRERCGNPDLLSIGTSATMVAGKATSAKERRTAVAEFASRLFGVSVEPENIIEESLRRITSAPSIPEPEALRDAILSSVPTTTDQILNNSLTAWIELTFGIEKEEDGNLRRRTPLSLMEGAERIVETTGLESQRCLERLRESFLVGSKLRMPDGNPLFALKLHQFIAQGRTIYATLEPTSKRFLTLEGQYYAPADQCERILYPVLFCRVCGQDYYSVLKKGEDNQFFPNDPKSDSAVEEETSEGYLLIPSENMEQEWSPEYIPAEWLEQNGKVKRDYRQHVPQPVWVLPDGTFSSEPQENAVKAWFQPKPFMLCLNCGEFYTRRDKLDFRKLTGLSSEGRSTSTTVLSVSALRNAPAGGINESVRKILSFTDNRQDASLQTGHFNDFVQVSLLRAAIFNALKQHQQLRFDRMAEEVVRALGFGLKDIALNKQLQDNLPQSREVWNAFRELIEYRIYEDLRRGWRVVQPNLEQCGLLRIDYMGLKELCTSDTVWDTLPSMRGLAPEKRQEILMGLLDHIRKKLGIYVNCLREQYQQQIRKRVQQHIDESWSFDEKELLWTAARFLLPGQTNQSIDGLSLSETSLIGRHLRRSLSLTGSYSQFVRALFDILCSHGLTKKGTEQGAEFIQLDASSLIWCKGDGISPPPDPIYSRRVTSEVYTEVQRKANEYFHDFYQQGARFLHGIEAREHTAQISYDHRQDRERRFREGTLPCLFCSPTMELGIDISDLQLVHLRNVPPTPANYAQRSGRAGRKGDPALIFAYCSAGSAHDQYFFHHREEMVTGAVHPPRIDLGSEDLIKAHIHAIWLSKIQLSLGSSIADILEFTLDKFPLQENVKAQINLSEARLHECIEETNHILLSCDPDISKSGWYSQAWVENILRRAPEEFDHSFERWRELYSAADQQWNEANNILRYPVRDQSRRKRAEGQRREAERQKNILCNIETTREESDFYPYRYLASEGFLPGYNFPRLPVRAFIPLNDGEFISRPRFLALTEFGPRNIIYHESAKYEARRLVIPPGGLQSRKSRGKVCTVCGYFQSDAAIDLCENCTTRLDASTSVVIPLLEMPNITTWRRERITCDEEERRRFGYEVTTQFRFAPAPGGQKRIAEGTVLDTAETALLRMLYAPAAELYRINHGWRNSREKGFPIDLANGMWLKKAGIEDDEDVPQSSQQPDVIRLFVRDTQNLLLLYPALSELPWDDNVQATLQYALQRGIEQVFQIEESELISERIGSGAHRAILFWEASEGGIGVLRRLVDEPDALAQVAQAALGRCHFDLNTLENLKTDCGCACYDCLLSYTNQRDYPRLNRQLIKDFLARLSQSKTYPVKAGRDYDEHYRWLRTLTDRRSDVERKFLDHLYQSKRRLPDDAQKMIKDYFSIPDFFYQPNVCVFCDGSVHDEPTQREKDRTTREELKELGYRIVVIRYDRDLEEQIRQYSDIFGDRTV